jgi:GT2 family glycosyltransferase
MKEKVYIIILNWNGWRDTVMCLESVFANSYKPFTVIVCDNGSEDASVSYIREWAENAHISYAEYTKEQALSQTAPDESQLVLIKIGANLGFAGGNNIALRYVLKWNDFSYVWLLNNDTVITENALVNLIKHMKTNSKLGLCGSTLVYFNKPNTVQALGGAVYNKWLGRARHIGAMQEFHEDNYDVQAVEKQMQYVVGASMLVAKSFLQDVGLLCEEYFLYFEELDWAVRAKDKFALGYAADSIVYHKEGGSIGSNNSGQERSLKSDYYGIRNRLLFTQKHYPEAIFTVYLGLIVTLFNRIRWRQYDRVKLVCKIIIDSFTGRSRGPI